jgi:pyruvate formate lyase activating enzyme
MIFRKNLRVASYWKNIDSKVVCELCPHNCKISVNRRGICGVRENKDGKLYSLIYGLSTGAAVDPIEKKPLFHFYPGTDVLSFGTVGCNFKCMHCQNYTTSQSTVEASYIYLQRYDAQNIPNLAKKYGCSGVAWTYNEPTIWYEFTLECSKIVKKYNLYSVYVTNGFINEEPLKELSKYLDAMNIDIKAFSADFYRKVSRGSLEKVLTTAILAKQLGIFVEVTYLIIPTYNDSSAELQAFCKWVAENLSPETPCHFSRFHPDYKMVDVPPTPFSTLKNAYEIAKSEGLKYVYIGNVPHTEYENTYCPNCTKLLIERSGFWVTKNLVKNGSCPNCATQIPIITKT